METVKILLCVVLFWGGVLKTQIIYQNEKAPKLWFSNWSSVSNIQDSLIEKPILLEFWASWCKGCISTIPKLNKLAEMYSNRMTFISVNSYESLETIKDFLQRKEVKSIVYHDKDQALKNAFNIHVIPIAILIDKKGFLRWKGYPYEINPAFIDVFLQNNDIPTHSNTNLIDEEFSIYSDSLHQKEASIALHIQKFTYSQTDSSTTSIDWEFEKSFYLKFSNVSIILALKYLYSYLYGDKVMVNFLGKQPFDYNIDFTAQSSVANNKTFILKKIIKKLSDEFSFEINESQGELTSWYLEPKGKKLENYQSRDQSKTRQQNYKENEFIDFKNIQLSTLSNLIEQITQERIRYTGTHTIKYDLKIEFIKDINSMNSFLENAYGLTLKPERELIKVVSIEFK